MQTSLLNHRGEFLGHLGVVQRIWGEVTFKHKFRKTFQSVSAEDSGSIIQSTEDVECIISFTFAFKTLGLGRAYACSFLTTMWKSKFRTE